MNRFIFPILFCGIALIAVSGIMVMQQMGGVVNMADTERNPEPNQAQTGSKASGIAAAITTMFESVTGQEVIKSDVALTPFLPVTPEGWTVANYVTADGEAITQTTISRGPIYKDSTNQLLLSFEDGTRGRVNAAALTFTEGDQTVAFLLKAPDQFNSNTVRGGMMEAITQNIASATDFGETSAIFALHHGVPFSEADPYQTSPSTRDDIPVDFRVFNGNVGGMFDIKILTNASDDAVAKVLEGIPMAALIAQVPEPEPQLLVSTEFATFEAVLDSQKPAPTIARQAYLIEKTRLDLTDVDKQILDDMRDGDVKTWHDAFGRFGTADGADPAIVSLLGPLPELIPAQHVEYKARGLLQADQDWTDADKGILNGMSRLSIVDRAGIDSYLDDGEAVSESVIALISMLPEIAVEVVAEVVPVETPEVARELVIRRGNKTGKGASTFGNCNIENGVRRCIVGAVGDN